MHVPFLVYLVTSECYKKSQRARLSLPTRAHVSSLDLLFSEAQSWLVLSRFTITLLRTPNSVLARLAVDVVMGLFWLSCRGLGVPQRLQSVHYICP